MANTRVIHVCLTCLLWLAIAARTEAAENDLGLKVPPGFEVSLYAGDDLAHDIFSMTFDAKGRVVVAGPNYIKVLHDDDGDGKADRATLFSDKPASGAHGLCFDGDNLLCTGDNGLWKLRDTDGDGQVDTQEKWATLKHSEHGTNAVVRGPDGWFYVITGNDAGVGKQNITTDGSPVKEPRCGALLRFSPDGKQSEVIAHGFRNPYGLDVDAYGHWFTVDSDNEREHLLPWYAPSRLFDIAPGREHGWLLPGFQKSFNRPGYFFDSVPRLVEIGRGSPTGLVVYRHTTFPEKYRNGVFSACWTLGRIYFMSLILDGASYRSQLETFLETTGGVGLAPTGLAVAPNGDLFICVGGRGTRGGVYRIRYTEPVVAPQSDDPLTRVLTAPQPQTAWSRANWLPAAKQISGEQYLAAAMDQKLTEEQRLRAVEVMTELCDDSTTLAQKLSKDPRFQAAQAPRVLACAVWSIGRKPDAASTLELSRLSRHPAPEVQRSAWEALMTIPAKDLPESSSLLTTYAARATVDDRVRAAAFQMLRYRTVTFTFSGNARLDEPRLLASQWVIKPNPEQALQVFRTAKNKERLEAVRLVQLACGDLKALVGQFEAHSGYQCEATDRVLKETRNEIGAALAGIYPTDSEPLNAEIERTLAILSYESPAALEAITKFRAEKGTVEDDLHALIVLSLLPGKRTADQTRRIAELFAGLHRKLPERKAMPSRNWPLRVGEVFEALVKLDEKLPEALADCKDFHYADQSLFVLKLRGEAQNALARKLWSALKQAPETDDWTPQLIEAVKILPREEYLATFRAQWDNPGLRDALALVLADAPEAADRGRLGQALRSLQPNVVRQVASALMKLPRDYTPTEAAALLKALRQSCLAPAESATRKALIGLLTHWSGQSFAIDEQKTKDLSAAYQPCFDWFADRHPEEHKQHITSTTYDAAAWQARLAKLDFDAGDATRGKAVFEKRSCHRCHTGQTRLGPDLAGAAARFSRADLFTAILDPSKDVAPAYRTKQIATPGGEVHTGVLIYDSPESVLLQTGPDTTVRLIGVAPENMRDSPQSLMPLGLLNDATDADVADLLAYLRTLKK